jgi:hypothetical protein
MQEKQAADEDESDSYTGAARAGWKRRRKSALDSSEDEEEPVPSRQEHNSGRGNRTPQPCGLGVRITEPSARCTKKARRTSVGEGWSFCRPCWLQKQGTQTEEQARLAGIKQRQRRAKKLQEVPVVSASHEDSEWPKFKQSATLSKKSSSFLEGPPANKIVVQKSKESVESGESDDEEKEEEVTQSLNSSYINSGTQYDTIIVVLFN